MRRSRRIAAGDLTKLVTWQAFNAARSALTFDEAGERIPQFDDQGEHWASIEPLKGAALINATAILPARWSEVTMHAGIGPVRALDQLLYNGRVLVVQNVNDDFEAGAYLSIQVTETV